MQIKVYLPTEEDQLPKNLILPIQTHSANIIKIESGEENLENCDGIYSSRKNKFTLGVYTADCSAISFYDKHHYGVIHAGWRGLTNGIVENMLKLFNNPEVHVGPILQNFEIQKDFCYDQLYSKFSDRFFKIEASGRIIFRFQEALSSLLPDSATFDPRDTFSTPELASWRRDKTEDRNVTVIRANK